MFELLSRALLYFVLITQEVGRVGNSLFKRFGRVR